MTCTNQDLVYGAGYMTLDTEPVVFQVPDFGERFWVYALYDARTDEFAEIGKAYGTKPGFTTPARNRPARTKRATGCPPPTARSRCTSARVGRMKPS